MKPFVWIEARTPEQAVAELQAPRPELGSALLKAGGVDLLDRMKEGLDAPGRLINIRRAGGPEGLGEIRLLAAAGSEGPLLHIGALVTLGRLAEDPLIQEHAPALAAAAGGAATPQIRQAATLGGNLLQRPRCWYLRSALHPCKKKGGAVCFAQEGESDFHAVLDNWVCAAVAPSSTATALLAHAARFVALGPGGRRVAPLEDLLLSPSAPGADLRRDHRLGPAEVLCALQLPLLGPGGRSVYRKVKQKQSFDWPLGEVAVVLRREGAAVREARVVLGAAAPTPLRAAALEAALRAPRPDEEALRRAAAAALDKARPLRDNGYKVPLLRELLLRAARQALAEGGTDATQQ